MTAERPAQWSEESEAESLGAALLTGSLVALSGIVTSESYYHPANRAVYAALEALDAKSAPIDPAAVYEQCKIAGNDLRAVGGFDYLVELQTRCMTPSNAAYHAKVVARKAERRRWGAKLAEMAAKAYGGGDDEEFMKSAETALLELSTTRGGDGPKHIKRGIKAAHLEWNARIKAREGGGTIGVTTGFTDLDMILGGLRSGRMYVLAARPSMGKSALAGNVAVSAAKAGAAVLVFSLEMDDISLVERMVAAEARLDAARFQRGLIEPPNWARITGAQSDLVDLGIWFEDSSSMDIADVRSMARRWRSAKAKDRNALVIVDYLQLIDGDGDEKNREREVAKISRGLKSLAGQIQAPVLALSQLNRGLEGREDKRPKLSDLRESGAIEQDADAVLFLYRDEVYHPACEDPCERCAKHGGKGEVIVAKQRGGQLGTVNLAWLPQFTKFENLSSREG